MVCTLFWHRVHFHKTRQTSLSNTYKDIKFHSQIKYFWSEIELYNTAKQFRHLLPSLPPSSSPFICSHGNDMITSVQVFQQFKYFLLTIHISIVNY